MKRPKTLDKLSSLDSWGCKRYLDATELACSLPNMCKLYSRVFQQDRYLYTCSECPQKYPWIRNEFGFD
ncbi:unnamed protein product [Phyllotreta striolata]|uniref:Uncharacterized protein n=1 Tax=Phyllotreta striolata TaxID=444603 RepID=A0A9N9XQ16_PHYSR|nr:unnamed protein product [Phyllotreta striolata]